MLDNEKIKKVEMKYFIDEWSFFFTGSWRCSSEAPQVLHPKIRTTNPTQAFHQLRPLVAGFKKSISSTHSIPFFLLIFFFIFLFTSVRIKEKGS